MVKYIFVTFYDPRDSNHVLNLPKWPFKIGWKSKFDQPIKKADLIGLILKGWLGIGHLPVKSHPPFNYFFSNIRIIFYSLVK